jgi:transcription antitermination factor NusG
MWFAVQTRSNFEKKAAAQLQEKSIETFLPLISTKHKWSDRQRVIEAPLFSSYVFVRILPIQELRVAVLRTIGVTTFVGARGLGSPIPSAEIHSIRLMLDHQIPFQFHPYLEIGQRVRIRGGCLEGIEGVLTGINGDESLVISIQSIQKSVAMRISGFEVEALRPLQGMVRLRALVSPTGFPGRSQDAPI